MSVQNTTYQQETLSKEFNISVGMNHLQSLEN